MKDEITLVGTAFLGMASILIGVMQFDQIQREKERERRLVKLAPRLARENKKAGLEFKPYRTANCDRRDGTVGINRVPVPVLIVGKMGYCSNFEGANLRGADLRGASLGSANLRNANLIAADLSESDLMGADLSQADLSGAELFSARFDRFTKLPFSVTEAMSRGMIKVGDYTSMAPRIKTVKRQSRT